jgi:hypothetical protein
MRRPLADRQNPPVGERDKKLVKGVWSDRWTRHRPATDSSASTWVTGIVVTTSTVEVACRNGA